MSKALRAAAAATAAAAGDDRSSDMTNALVESIESITGTRFRLGGSLVRSPVCFTEDEKTFFCCSGSVVKTFNVATGALLGILEGHTARVSAVLINPENNLQVYTTSQDGTIRLWDYIESTCLKEFNVGMPILSAVIARNAIYMNADPHHYTRLLYHANLIQQEGSGSTTPVSTSSEAIMSATASPRKKDKHKRAIVAPASKSCRILQFDLTTHKTTELYRSFSCRAIALSANQEHLASISDSDLTIYNTKRQTRATLQHSNRLTTVAFHPLNPILATGDEVGKIILWNNYPTVLDGIPGGGSAPTKLTAKAAGIVTKTLHWHSKRVQATAFSVDGSYLLSGGDEGVLVYWQLATDQKQFLPRLGGPLCNITTSPKGALYAVACADNAVRMIRAINNAICHEIQGLQHATRNLMLPSLPSAQKSKSERFQAKVDALQMLQELSSQAAAQRKARQHSITLATGLVRDPVSNSIALAGKTGCLQFFDVFNDRHVALVPITERNYTSQAPHDTPAHVSVEHVAFSYDGMWMATVDSWRMPGSPHERISLKFWQRGTRSFKKASKDSSTDELKQSSLESDSEFFLVARADSPHTSRVTSIQFHPSKYELVTTSTDATFKIWSAKLDNNPAQQNLNELRATTVKSALQARADRTKQLEVFEANRQRSEAQLARPSYSWSCIATAEYRNAPVFAASYSSDGSILAVSFGQVVTLWSPGADELTLQTTFVHPPPAAPIRWLKFVPNTPFLIATTMSTLYVWNLLSSSVHWSYQLSVASVAIHPVLPYFAVLALLPEPPRVEALGDSAKSSDGAGDGDTKDSNATEEKITEATIAGVIHKHLPRKCALFVFNAESPTPVRVIDASDVELEGIDRAITKNADDVSVNVNSATAGDALDLSETWTNTTVYTAALTFVSQPRNAEPSSRVGTNSSLAGDDSIFSKARRGALAMQVKANSDESEKKEVSDKLTMESLMSSSLVYMNRYRELIRIENALKPSQGDRTTAAGLLSTAAALVTTNLEGGVESAISSVPISSFLLDEGDAETKLSQRGPKAKVETIGGEAKTSLFGDLYIHATAAKNVPAASAMMTGEEVAKASDSDRGIHTALLSFLRTPAHVLGSLTLVYHSFMDSFLKKRVRLSE